VTKNGVLLSWTTASETSNAGFRIYRVVSGQTELLTPTLIPGAGTSVIPQRYEFVDPSVEPGVTYLYKLSDISLSGIERFATPVTLTVPSNWGTPSVVHLEPVRPCPARDKVVFSLSLAGQTSVRVSIYDTTGRLVRHLPRLDKPGGIYSMSWDLTDNEGSLVSPGLYFARVQGAGSELTRRIVVAR
jgi:hypothetical protein